MAATEHRSPSPHAELLREAMGWAKLPEMTDEIVTRAPWQYPHGSGPIRRV